MNRGLIIVTTSLCESLQTSLCQRGEIPLFGKEGRGEILRRVCLHYDGLLSNLKNLIFLYAYFRGLFPRKIAISSRATWVAAKLAVA